MMRQAQFALLLTLGFLLATFGSEAARACSCSAPSEQLLPVPPPGATVPRNVRPRLHYAVPLKWDAQALAQEKSHVRLLCLSPQGKEREPAFLVHLSSGFKSALVELELEREAEVGEKCAILSDQGEPLTYFHVGEQVDEEPPRAAYVSGGQASWEDNDSTCEVNGAQGNLYIVLGERDAKKQIHTSFAVYSSLDDAPLDYDGAPTTWVTAHRHLTAHGVGLVGGASCDPGGNFPYPPAGHSMKVGLVPVDLAGNRGPPTEALLPGVSRETGEVAILPLSRRPPRTPTQSDHKDLLLWTLVAGALLVAGLVVGLELRD